MKKRKFAAAAAVVFALSSCGAVGADEEAIFPILDEADAPKLRTAVVAREDIDQKKTFGANLGYIYADKLYTDFEGNILEYCVNFGDRLKEGDPIAVFDSSSLDYDYNNQKVLADNAYSVYLSTGSEAARLEYEIQAKQLEYIEYQKDRFTIRAPYDCFVMTVEYFRTGTVVSAGALVCTVAREDDIYVYTTDNTELFHLGMPIRARFGDNEEYGFHVVMMPEEGARRGRDVNLNACVVLKPDDGELERIKADNSNNIFAGWASVTVPVVEKHGVLTLPEEAVKTFSGSPSCTILENGRQARIPVEIEGVYNGKAVILSGLSEGDEVVY